MSRVRSYALNFLLGGHNVGMFSGRRERFKLGSIERPSSAFTFIEEAEIENGMYAVPLPPAVNWLADDFSANHHRGSYNLAFVDGHAESIRFLNLDQLKPWGRESGS